MTYLMSLHIQGLIAYKHRDKYTVHKYTPNIKLTFKYYWSLWRKGDTFHFSIYTLTLLKTTI